MDGKETAVNGVALTGREEQGKASNGREGNSSEWSRIDGKGTAGKDVVWTGRKQQ